MTVHMRLLLPILLLAATLACNTSPRVVEAQAPQTWFRVTLGLTDAEPADWSGSIVVTGGRLAGLHELRFDKDDKLDAAAGTWICHTRRTVMADPRDWFVGAKHVVPSDMTPPKGAIISNALEVAIEGAADVVLRLPQGRPHFAPDAVKFGAPLELLDGKVRVERVPQPSNLTAGDGFENDQPAISQSWLAWISYKGEKERLMISRHNGTERQSIAEGEFLRPSLAGDFLAVSMRAGDTWKIAVARRTNDRWSALEPISKGGPDLFPVAAVDSAGNLWVAWQGFRDGRSRILSRRFDGKAWGAETTISDNTRDAWMPSISAGPNGAMHFAWDAYDDGVFNVYYKSNQSPMRRVLPSPRYQAYASVACDRSGQVWLAWEEAGANWGKDTGFLVRERPGTALYEDRVVRAMKLGGSAQTIDGEQPRILATESGPVVLVRRRNIKNQAVFSPSLQRDRVQKQSIWDYALVDFAGRWSAIPLPLSGGRNDVRGAAAVLSDGRVMVAWNGDGRTFAVPYPYVKNDILTASLAPPNTGKPAAAQPAPASVSDSANYNPRLEAASIARLRNARIGSLQVLRGDMHRHTDISFDGDLDGGPLEFYRYMIDAAAMDYGALTDHHAGDNKEYFWWMLQKYAKTFYYPGRFTPLFAYERSLRFPNGHRNLIWSKEGVHALPTTAAEEAGTEGAARLYAYLRESGGLAMSHTSATLMGTDWRDNDPRLEPIVEIYQGDRTSAEYEGAPRAPKGSDPNTQPGGYKAEGFVWNAWAKGYKLGVQASSDHSSTHISYAVILAADRSREGILKAIASRHSYAATDNILLDVRAGEHLQGDAFALTGKPRLDIRIEGTAPIDQVEVIRNNQFVYSNRPGKASVTWHFDDNDPKSGESYYYVRVRQSDGQMAWSSPIWITR